MAQHLLKFRLFLKHFSKILINVKDYPNEIRVYTLCIFGMGTALLLRMLVETALKELGIDAEVTTTNLTAISGLVASGNVDLIVAQADLEPQLSQYNVPTIFVKNFTDKEGLKEEIKKVLNLS